MVADIVSILEGSALAAKGCAGLCMQNLCSCNSGLDS